MEKIAVNYTGQRIVHRIRKIRSETRLGSADAIIIEGGGGKLNRWTVDKILWKSCLVDD